MIDALIFDVGGVLLVPRAEPIANALGLSLDRARAEEAHYHGVRALDDTDTLEAERIAYLDAYTRCVGVPEVDRPSARTRLQALFSASSLELWGQPVRGSVEALRSLAGGLRKLAIVSNADGTVEEQLRRSQICQVGEGLGVPVLAIIDSTVVGVAKPAAEIFRHALDPLGVSPDRAVYIGDTRKYDVAGARAAGLVPIHFDPYLLCPTRDDHQHVASLSEIALL